ncbi:hypothetical protein, unlikely [Trypanosoma brucei gambiense DAL972]|uniref:T. brucei spp.-specific protein n=1 Tax=Trypanosoma brucei gambiense (strain MHOM/CI/86/DAL972) TaxID=679716 RepID=C9ZQN3_TRYB9|nr:hypothetical protein, unlikely [Trypanosoma brucei gambiense DAL972]CBH11713.1 hypothetical protein, unlikely [Trypanosoma brucei gambiense DAL972]|eukprot:XP_011773998.1 hypothetical protein, unlikely [Trypanosoma brucei gambiense DAL972]
MFFSWYTTNAIFFSRRRKFRSSCGNNRLRRVKRFEFRVFSTSGTFFTGASESFVCRWWRIFAVGRYPCSFYQHLAVCEQHRIDNKPMTSIKADYSQQPSSVTRCSDESLLDC